MNANGNNRPSPRHGWHLQEWCALYGFSRGHYYDLKKRGKAPRAFKSGARDIITAEADAEWRREREAESQARETAAA